MNALRISPILAILLVSFCLNICGVWWGLPSSRGWAPDELVPSVISIATDARFSQGWYQVYPPLHYYVLGLTHLPFLALHKLNLIDFNSSAVYTTLFFISRFLSILLATGIVYVVYLLGLEITDKKTSLFAALITALMTPFIYYSKIANVDIPSFFWFSLSMLFYVRILKNHKLSNYLLFTAAATLSVCTKDQMYGFYILTAIAIVYSYHLYLKKNKMKAPIKNCLFNKRIGLSLLLGVVLFVLLHNFIFNFKGVLNHFSLLIGWASPYGKLFENSLSGHLQLFWQTLKHIHFSFGWPVFILCFSGLLLSFIHKKKDRLLFWILIPALSYYIFLISVTLSNYVRYLIPVCILLSFFSAKSLSFFLNPGWKFPRIRWLLVSMLLIFTLVYSGSVDIMMVKDSRYAVEKWMAKNIRKDALVGFFSSIEYLPRLDKFRNVFFSPDIVELKAQSPDYIVLNSDYSHLVGKDTVYYRLYNELRRGSGYKLIYSYKYRSRWILLNLKGIYTNLDKINPTILIFEKVSFPSVP